MYIYSFPPSIFIVMVVCSSPMVKSEVHESEDASGGAKNDWDTLRRSILRRRPSVGGLFDYSSLQRDIPEEDMVRDSSSKDFVATAAKSVEEDKDRVKADNAAVNANREKAVDISALKFLYRPSVPVHRTVKESPLSSDKIFHQSHAGLLNLCIVVLVAVNSRLIIENLMKYGLLIKYGFWFSSKSLRDWPLFMCCLTLAIFPIASYLVEILAQRKQISEPAIISFHIFITTAAVLYPVLVILRCDSAILSAVTLMLFACNVWLKLVSYAHTNSDLRALSRSIEKGEESPNNLKMEYSYTVSFKSLVYFMVAPTLCYQPSYPRTPSIRKRWVFRQVVKLIIFTGVMGFIVEQYINPIVQNSQHPLKGNLLYAIERVLKLSVPNLYVWLCMFYCFFHLWLNILAELLRFGDREFYKDWWNAQTVEEYWRMWNMPVHTWMVRHLYFPCLRHGIPKGVAVLISFFVSAVFHELCIAVPCHIFKLWAFIGIMFQVPLVLITNYLQNKFTNSMVGNMVFWFIFSILGQPMCVLLYYHDLMNRNKGID
ncbi:diacylglycerol O-acyltransferase 1A-like isoform X3 [Prosopis cineraria]|uniref:diacylglycerol O-acyltransferase 1A-like isoform X3 n=1 Tax=Prosopis cineraria TaxID=364024 RepID=UPI002410153C|nr:diacylglycerol O-acyltransferase 1A-like isoform X3 [Prosopis cineraria]